MENASANWLTIGQAAKFLGVSRDTLRRWGKRGKLKAVRSPTNRRYYTKKQLEEIMGSGKEAVSSARAPIGRHGFPLSLPFVSSSLVLGIIGFIVAVLLSLAFLVLFRP